MRAEETKNSRAIIPPASLREEIVSFQFDIVRYNAINNLEHQIRELAANIKAVKMSLLKKKERV